MDCKLFDSQKLENVYKIPEDTTTTTDGKKHLGDIPETKGGIICPTRFVDCTKFGGYDPND